ncbi:hypothetical protein, partial [Pseudomonas sp. Irchel 3E19]|uniref:hypothetical protein n=1 Tax=Pseudomonas sp. Irchel 3E19 TaxID=2008981 RepID=UPI0011404527
EHEACGLAFEFSGKRTTLFGHQTPLSGEHSRLNGCPVSLDHYTCLSWGSFNPQLADKPFNIYPVTREEHLYRWHDGNFQKDTMGKPLNPLISEDF